MNRRHCLLAALGLSAAICSPLACAQTPSAHRARALGELKSLGQDRYQIGRIVVDKRAGTFTVPGRVHVLGKPLEYLATSPGGMKAYETLLELDATGSEFNLACILVGLERDPKQADVLSRQPEPLVGQRVAIYIAWSEGGKRRQVSAADALLNPDAGVKPESVEWVYTGVARVGRARGRFAADVTGTLVGFVHDPNNVIESVVGIGIGAYGSVHGNAMLPPVGSAIELIVEAANAQKVIAARWAMLLVAAVLILAAFGATRLPIMQPSALRVMVTAVVGLLAPLFWPGSGATPARTALRIAGWSVAAACLAAIALRILGNPAQPFARILRACAMLMLILL